jgi:predicted lipoprotein
MTLKCCIAILIILIPLTTPLTVVAQDFDREAMLTSLVDNVIVPQHAAFVADAAALEAALLTLEAQRSEVNRVLAQVAWKNAWASWSETVVFSSQRLVIIQNQISKPPANVEFIEAFIADEGNTLDAAFIAGVGSTSKGLPAIEYLIFGDSVPDTRHLMYLVALGQNVHSTAQELLALWQGDTAAEFIGANQAGMVLRSSISMLTNDMAALVESIAQMNIGVPLGTSYTTDPTPTAANAFRSRQSSQEIIHNLIGLQAAFTGGDGLGFDDYLDFLGAESSDGLPLSQAILDQITLSIAALDGLVLEDAILQDPATLEAAQAEILRLLVLLKVDMANQLGVTITFSDNDGD